MRTIRRLYFYLVVFISVLTLVWGITNLLRSLIDRQIPGYQVNILSAGLAQVLVSIPILLLHWLVVQKDALKNEEEKNSLVRALFLYTSLIATLIPAIQNLLALINRLLLTSVNIPPQRALFGGSQTISDNLIAIVTNLVLAGYFYRVLQSEWSTSTEKTNLTEIRRLHQYLWMLYGLSYFILGVQKEIHFLLYLQQGIGTTNREDFVNGIALLVIGMPIWIFWWRRIQKEIHLVEEAKSTLRLIVLYLLSIGGALTAFVSSGWILAKIISRILGEEISLQSFFSSISIPVSLLIPFGAVWIYYYQHLQSSIQHNDDVFRRFAFYRLYRYLLSAAGLGGFIYGLIRVFGFLINQLIRRSLNFDTNLSYLSSSMAVLLTGFIVWLVHWSIVDQQSKLEGGEGDQARRSLIRKIYLYAAVFACVIGNMVSVGYLIYTLLQSALGIVNGRLWIDVLLYARMVVVFGIFLVYHLRCLNRDARSLSKSIAEHQSEFRVAAILDADSEMATQLKKTFSRYAQTIPLIFIPPELVDSERLKDVEALILTSSQLIAAAEENNAVHKYEKDKIILTDSNDRKIFLTTLRNQADIYKACAQTVRSLSEGQPVKPYSSTSAWMIVAYIVLGLFGLQILLAILGSLFSGID